jgi:hypothetical protein
MKTMLILATMLSFATVLYGQDTTALATQKEYYLKKAKNQKTTGWVLLGTGSAAGIIGIALMASNGFVINPTEENENAAGTGGVLFTTGVLCDLASIPFFISAGKNKRRAAEISAGTQKTYLPLNSALTMRYIPSLTVKIDF